MGVCGVNGVFLVRFDGLTEEVPKQYLPGRESAKALTRRFNSKARFTSSAMECIQPPDIEPTLKKQRSRFGRRSSV